MSILLLLLNKKSKAKVVTSSGPSPLLTGLTHYWKLDELTGNRLDTVGSMHMVPSGAVGYEPGILGNAATFAASPNYLLGTGYFLSVPSTGATVWGWVKLVNTTGRPTILNQEGAVPRWTLFDNSSTQTKMSIQDSAGAVWSEAIDNVTVHSTGVWRFMCGRYNPSTKKAELRIDAGAWTIASTALPNGPIVVSDGVLRMNRFASTYGTCSIDSVGFAARYYSDAEVSLLYNGGAGKEYPF